MLFDKGGATIASHTIEYPLYQPQNGWAEQDPEDWWRAASGSISAVIAKSGIDASEIAGVGLSGQMHSLVCLDGDGKVLRKAILWCDQRTQKQCDWITEKAGGLEKLLTYTNNRMLTGYTGGKVWSQDKGAEGCEADTIGMKTGYTRQAEYCLMSAFKCGDGRQLVIGVFGYANELQRFREAIAMADACKALMK